MPPAELAWFRMWTDAVDNPKLRLLAFEDRWHFVALCCLKRAGIVDKLDDPNRDRMIAVKLGVQARELDEIKRRLLEVRLIDEQLNPIGWDDRQFQSDRSTERVRAFRERRRNVSETPPETETETETEKKDARARDPAPEGLNLDAWERWEQYRRAIRRPIKPASVLAAQRKLAGYGSEQAAVVEHSIANGYQGLWEPKDGPRRGQQRRSDGLAV